jgi:hypothetical protein
MSISGGSFGRCGSIVVEITQPLGTMNDPARDRIIGRIFPHASQIAEQAMVIPSV